MMICPKTGVTCQGTACSVWAMVCDSPIKVTPAMHAEFQAAVNDPLAKLRLLAQWLEFADGSDFIPAVEAAIEMMEANGKLPQRERNGESK